MRILLDQGTPVPLRRALPDHVVSTAFEKGWAHLSNGDLLDAAERDYDVLITTHQNLRHQQNLAKRRIAVLVLPTTGWPILQAHVAQISIALKDMTLGEYRELGFSN